MGYRVGWYAEGLQKCDKWYERGWCWAEDKYYDPYAPIVNYEVIDKLPEYKYSAYKQYGGENLFKYLRVYEKYPQAEMFVKLLYKHHFIILQNGQTVERNTGVRTAKEKFL